MTLIIDLLADTKLITLRQFKEITFLKNWMGKPYSSKVINIFALRVFSGL